MGSGAMRCARMAEHLADRASA